MYRSLVASVLLTVLALSQGVSATVYESTNATGHSLLAAGYTDYFLPCVGTVQPTSNAGFAKLSIPKIPAFTWEMASAVEHFFSPHLISFSGTSDHDKTWITEATTRLYPAHEFS